MNQRIRVLILFFMMISIVILVSFLLSGLFIVGFGIQTNMLLLFPITIISWIITICLYSRFVPAYKRLNRYFVLERKNNATKTVSLSHEAHWWFFRATPRKYARLSMNAIHELMIHKGELEKDGVEFVEAYSMIFKFDGLPIEKMQAKTIIVRPGLFILHLSNLYNWTAWIRIKPKFKEINKIHVTLDELEHWYQTRYARY